MQIDQQQTNSLISHLECPNCGITYYHQELHTVCEYPECKSSLIARYNLFPGVVKMENLAALPPTIASSFAQRESAYGQPSRN